MASEKSKAEGLYWTPMGGNNEANIWGSCHVFASAVKENDEIVHETIIVDMGRQESPKKFADGRYDTVIPALDDYLNVPKSQPPEKENEAKAIFLTHAHTDHINGLYEYVRMGVELPPIYATEFTINMVKKGFVENGIDWNLIPEFHPIKSGDVIEIGNMKVEASRASHSIPGALSFKISNPHATIFHSGDTKADPTSFLEKNVEKDALEKMAAKGPIDLMTFDATATHLDGHARYETEICDAYTELFQKYGDKQIIAPISAGHMERLATVVAAAEKAGKDVIINGGSTMQSHIMGLSAADMRLEKIFSKVKVLSYKNPDVKKLNPKNTVTITTGIYGNEESPFIKLLKNEKSLFQMDKDAAIIVPLMGDKNEELHKILDTVENKDKLTVVTAKEYPDLYGSGHAQKDDFTLIASQLKPKHIVPIHCARWMAENLIDLATEQGYGTLKRHIRNGETIRVSAKDGVEIVKSKEPEWFGLKHRKDRFGDIKTRYVKVPDFGYSTSSNSASLIAKKQMLAIKKIAEYRKKNKTTSIPPKMPPLPRGKDAR